MITGEAATATKRPVAPFAVGAVGPVAAVVAVLQCAASTFGNGYWFDEMYMLAIGRRRCGAHWPVTG